MIGWLGVPAVVSLRRYLLGETRSAAQAPRRGY